MRSLTFVALVALPLLAGCASGSAQLDCAALSGHDSIVSLDVQFIGMEAAQRSAALSAMKEWSTSTCNLVSTREVENEGNVTFEFFDTGSDFGWTKLGTPTRVRLNRVLSWSSKLDYLRAVSLHELGHVVELRFDESSVDPLHYLGNDESVMGYIINPDEAFIGTVDLEAFCRRWLPGDVSCHPSAK